MIPEGGEASETFQDVAVASAKGAVSVTAATSHASSPGGGGNGGGVASYSEDATASTSDPDDESDHDGVVDRDGEAEQLPLLKYVRIHGAVPRARTEGSASSSGSHPLSTPATCAQLGRIKLSRDDAASDARQALDVPPVSVLLTGYATGSISFVHGETGCAIVESKQLLVDESSGKHGIVDVSLDASSNYLAAINAGGTCVIWEVRYAPSDEYTASNKNSGGGESNASAGEPENNVFASFLTTLAGQSMVPSQSASNDSASGSRGSGCCIKATVVSVSSRVTYSFGRPTCLCLDPSYKRRREKAILVAFADGRLVLSKKGMFGRRNDAVLYHAAAGGGGGGGDSGIEAVEWRGALVAWADASGIKLFDVESMTRIAHIDRPVGARASLYPTISSLKPCMHFETSSDLVVAWGDCVMTMHIQETIVRQVATDNKIASGPTAETAAIVKRRQVSCSMAWELDCVACGVAPLDKDHLIVLGLVPNENDAGDDDTAETAHNDVEVQIISRAAGSVTYADALPILRIPSQFIASQGGNALHENASAYHLLSSFAIPRMEDTVEADEEGTAGDSDFDFTLFASNTNAPSFVDSHLRWSLGSLEFDGSKKSQGDDGDEKADDDSDDYGFLVRESSEEESEDYHGTAFTSSAPVMVVQGPADLIAISTRDVDDAIAHALALGKMGLALHRALRHTRQVRKHDLVHLIDSFLSAVLSHRLSVRRLELAARSTPALLGGSMQRWEKWIQEFSRIPGALFVLCDQIPVRDPKLPSKLYIEILSKLLQEIEGMLIGENQEHNDDSIVQQAIDRFLAALCAWGPTHALREKIRFLQYHIEQERKRMRDGVNTAALDRTEETLDRRLMQAATSYLQLPSSASRKNVPSTSNALIVDSSADSLFPVKEFMMKISSRVPILQSKKSTTHISQKLLNSKVALEALAELSVMGTKYETALQCYLAIGSLYSPQSMEDLEKQAVDRVNHADEESAKDSYAHNAYGFVLSMVEHHHLHGALLDSELLPHDASTRLSPPLVSLVRLLGLDLTGDFLVEHCVPPPGRTMHHGSTDASSAKSGDSRGSSSRATKEGDETLPINLVADQLQSSPAVLHWYLHLIFTKKPEMYVHFPTTAVPPRAVTELHRINLDLYIEFAEDRDSALSLASTEVYNHERKTTPLITFLKAALPLGGILPDEVRRLLEAKRSESMEDVTEFPHSFSLELAYVIDNYGDGSLEESHQVLDLYLKGAKSVMLAAAYAQRNTEHASILWETLIQYCLAGGEETNEGLDEANKVDGTLFGSLLEAAALVGADLALLVTSIPQRMNIEGLRPRLVAAVADYRMKLTMHETAAEACRRDRITLLRELGHRSRRGMRQANSDNGGMTNALFGVPPPGAPTATVIEEKVEPALRRPRERPSRYRLSVRLPMR